MIISRENILILWHFSVWLTVPLSKYMFVKTKKLQTTLCKIPSKNLRTEENHKPDKNHQQQAWTRTKYQTLFKKLLKLVPSVIIIPLSVTGWFAVRYKSCIFKNKNWQEWFKVFPIVKRNLIITSCIRTQRHLWHVYLISLFPLIFQLTLFKSF